MSVISMTM